MKQGPPLPGSGSGRGVATLHPPQCGHPHSGYPAPPLNVATLHPLSMWPSCNSLNVATLHPPQCGHPAPPQCGHPAPPFNVATLHLPQCGHPASPSTTWPLEQPYNESLFPNLCICILFLLICLSSLPSFLKLSSKT